MNQFQCKKEITHFSIIKTTATFLMVLIIPLLIIHLAGAQFISNGTQIPENINFNIHNITKNDVIIIFEEKPGLSEKALIHENGGHIRYTYNFIPAVSARITEQAADNLSKNPRIASIEEDIIISIASPEYTDSWGVSHIGSEMVHNNSINGSGVKIAVIDTGIDYTHEDLENNYKGGYDFVFNDTDPFDDSYNSHGTHIAGIIAAQKNGIGVVGVAPEADLYAVKVLDGSGFGLASWLIAGIEWAVENDMDIASISIGTTSQNPKLESLRMACGSAYNSGLLLVASAGNTFGGEVMYPARYDSVIAVTATDPNDQQASFSSIGQEIELAAPGVEILSTIKEDHFDNLSGTSQAVPHVTGLAALIIFGNHYDVNKDGNVNHEDIRMQLQLTAKDLGEVGKDEIYGYGLIDAQSAVFYNSSEPDKPESNITINLHAGWNLISVPLNLTTWKLGNESIVQDPLNVTPQNNLTSIYRCNTTSGLFEKNDHIPDWGWSPATGSDNFTQLEPGRGYWVMADQDCVLTFNGTGPDDLDIMLNEDWNLVGWYSMSEAMLGEEAVVGNPLNATPVNSLTSIYRYNATVGLFEMCDHFKDWGWWHATGSEGFTRLEPGRGYWVNVENDCVWWHKI